MSLRFILSVSLLAGWFSTGASGSAVGQSMTEGQESTACALQGAHGGARCVLVTSRPLSPHVLSDHGATVGDAYDAQGNPVDRHGNVVAVPEYRSRSGGPSGQMREVFVSEPQIVR